MLEIKNITKIYKTGDFEQKALNKVSLNFRESEFASILGPSGSGKTTFLNIIGGLDHYDSGDLIINEVSTKNFSDRDWDSYRNHRVGFVFQSYNLIGHQTVLRNVELALTLSGCSKEERKKKALKALKDVGLEKHANKRPNQLSGGQMQRVAIARALVNNPEIILADEPTGALDSDTSIQIMKILKEISKEKLVIMVTHNSELAEEYSSRIINLKDGKIISDSNPYDGKLNTKEVEQKVISKTKMSFLTALSLSFNNLMTKKGRTTLVSVAGSIGIIGIALIMAVSTGFQNYVDSIQEDTLTSYPLTIMQESSDITSVLLSMRNKSSGKKEKNQVVEQQYITSMLSNVSTNDLKSFKKYIEKNYHKIETDISNIKYSYSVDPNIYTIDATKKLAQVNPSNLFTSMIGSNSLMSSYSGMSSIYSQMIDDVSDIEDDYDMLAGSWPKNYDEMIIVLSEPDSISDLLVYSLGLRDTEELTQMITSIMGGDTVDINNKPMTITYEKLMKSDLRLIMPSDRYKYNPKYDVYEDMQEDKTYMRKLYDNATKLKIVGIVSPKEGVATMALNPGVAYTSKLIDYIINYSKETNIVKKQLQNSEIDVFSGNRFDSKKSDFDFKFTDLVKVDNKKLKSAFNINVDKKTLENQTQDYMDEIASFITTDITPASNLFNNNLSVLIKGLLNSIDKEFSVSEIEMLVNNYLDTADASNILLNMEKNYVIPKNTFKTTYNGLLKGLLQAYITGYNTYMASLDPGFVIDSVNPKGIILPELKDTIVSSYIESAAIKGTGDVMAKAMTEAKVKKDVLTKVGELTANITNNFATSFNIDQDKIASAFTLNFTEDELARVVNAIMNPSKTTQKTNLISLGYQDKEEPTYVSVYFTSFEGKENFLSFIDKYNKSVEEPKEIKYTDTTGILMSTVKTIVNAVSYVLIAFVSISLVVSSIMIGVITYISVYERTKEIGILRAIGASKGNISSIFNAETFIIGMLSGLFGIGISYLLIPIINIVLHHYIGNIPLNASLPILNAFVLVILAIILTLIGGLIPAKVASKKDPVEALRTE
ncbi:MAG: ATP-binding cassette domain-containing protein [Mollicutes bacterium]|nr:ATP-binding cassette domain-containing protein [Mollicutes bacterium]